MSARFLEIQKNGGVDETPVASMLVPRGGSNRICLLDAAGMQLLPDKKGLKIEEEPHKVPRTGEKLVHPEARVLRISGDRSFGIDGVRISVQKPGAPNPDTSLKVVVVSQRIVKLAIRPVKVRDGKGWRDHPKKAYDIAALVESMNKVWTPQANVRFQLVSKDPAELGDQAAIAKVLGAKASTAQLPDRVDTVLFSDMFKSFRVKDADMTIFLVAELGRINSVTFGGSTYGPEKPDGTAQTEHKMAFVSDAGRDLGNGERAIAHEAGHILGSFNGMNGWISYGHPEVDKNMLMSDGGGGTKLTVKSVLSSFNSGY